MTSEPEDAPNERLLSDRRANEPPESAANGRGDAAFEASFGERAGRYGELPEDQSLLRNPYVLAGLAVAAAIVLAVMVVVAFGGGGGGRRGGGSDEGNVVVSPLTPQPGGGIEARTLAAAAVREGPSTDYLEIAPMRSGQVVEVVGRNAEGTWFQIYYPPQSPLKGWLPATALRLPGGAAESLAVVAITPTARPTIALPTSTAEPPETPTATPAGTPTPAGGPDLALTFFGGCQMGVPLVVSVRNAGNMPILNRQVRVTVASASGVQGVADNTLSLEPGAIVNIATNQVVPPPRAFARIDLIGIPTDVNPTNNAAECVVQGAGVPPLPTPPPSQILTPTPTRAPGP